MHGMDRKRTSDRAEGATHICTTKVLVLVSVRWSARCAAWNTSHTKLWKCLEWCENRPLWGYRDVRLYNATEHVVKYWLYCHVVWHRNGQ
jgi:hypothetical protein